MRKFNTIISAALLVLVFIHIIGGMFQLAGIIPGGGSILTKIAYISAALIAVHAVIGIKLTFDTLRVMKINRTKAFSGKASVSTAAPGKAEIREEKRTGSFGKSRPYFRENLAFWTRRISGFAMLLFVLIHVIIFLGKNDEVYRLTYFGALELISQLLMVLAIVVHVLTNIRPLMISAGSWNLREYLVDVLFILSVVLLLSAAALVVYFIRWNLIL